MTTVPQPPQQPPPPMNPRERWRAASLHTSSNRAFQNNSGRLPVTGLALSEEAEQDRACAAPVWQSGSLPINTSDEPPPMPPEPPSPTEERSSGLDSLAYYKGWAVEGVEELLKLKDARSSSKKPSTKRHSKERARAKEARPAAGGAGGGGSGGGCGGGGGGGSCMLSTLGTLSMLRDDDNEEDDASVASGGSYAPSIAYSTFSRGSSRGSGSTPTGSHGGESLVGASCACLCYACLCHACLCPACLCPACLCPACLFVAQLRPPSEYRGPCTVAPCSSQVRAPSVSAVRSHHQRRVRRRATCARSAR